MTHRRSFIKKLVGMCGLGFLGPLHAFGRSAGSESTSLVSGPMGVPEDSDIRLKARKVLELFGFNKSVEECAEKALRWRLVELRTKFSSLNAKSVEHFASVHQRSIAESARRVEDTIISGMSEKEIELLLRFQQSPVGKKWIALDANLLQAVREAVAQQVNLFETDLLEEIRKSSV